MSDIGLGLNKYEILSVIRGFLNNTDQTDIFSASGSSPKWYSGFCYRWKYFIRPRMAQKS